MQLTLCVPLRHISTERLLEMCIRDSFSGGLIPTDLNLKSLHLNNTLWGLIIPWLINTFNMIIMRTAFESIPESLIEAAQIDGATHWKILRSIVLPLSKATLAVMVLYYGVETVSYTHLKMMAHMGPLLTPLGFSVEAYKKVFLNPNIISGYKNTLIILVVGVSLNLVMTSLAAYVLSRTKVCLFYTSHGIILLREGHLVTHMEHQKVLW